MARAAPRFARPRRSPSRRGRTRTDRDRRLPPIYAVTATSGFSRWAPSSRRSAQARTRSRASLTRSDNRTPGAARLYWTLARRQDARTRRPHRTVTAIVEGAQGAACPRRRPARIRPGSTVEIALGRSRSTPPSPSRSRRASPAPCPAVAGPTRAGPVGERERKPRARCSWASGDTSGSGSCHRQQPLRRPRDCRTVAPGFPGLFCRVPGRTPPRIARLGGAGCGSRSARATAGRHVAALGARASGDGRRDGQPVPRRRRPSSGMSYASTITSTAPETASGDSSSAAEEADARDPRRARVAPGV